MEQRTFKRTGQHASVVGLGTWQLGADWGNVSEVDALEVLNAAADEGVTFFDTADVYGDGRSEKLIGRFLAGRPNEDFMVATKMGRRAPLEPEQYTLRNFRKWTERSLKNLGVERLDLVQLHCPPSAVLGAGAVYDALDALVDEGRIAAYGVSVETTDEALQAISRPALASVQIIFNPFRMKPLDQVLPAASEAGVGVIARVPLASGLLSGKYTTDTAFAPDDHRNFNRHGEAFDQGETFAGVDFETGLAAAQQFSKLAAPGATPAQTALRWIIQQPGITTVIPGARSAKQVLENAAAADLPPLPAPTLTQIRELYDADIRSQVHHRW